MTYAAPPRDEGSCFGILLFIALVYFLSFAIGSWLIVNERAVSACKASDGVASRNLPLRWVWSPPALVFHGRVVCIDGSVKQIRANNPKKKK